MLAQEYLEPREEQPSAEPAAPEPASCSRFRQMAYLLLVALAEATWLAATVYLVTYLLRHH